ncbi:MAG: carboxylating nicotinate-nucleotide diphosphorylase, partial [Bacteroidia bacterium]
CIPANAVGKAQLLVKDEGIIAGIDIAKHVFHRFDKNLSITTFLNDGDSVKHGDIAFIVEGKKLSILQTERLVLNIIQRMSAIATKTNFYAQLLAPYKTKVLDTRKTTPGLRVLEKMAVKIGGGENHRMGLYDMIMLKDNHIDFAGGITEAITKTLHYLKEKNLDLNIEVEARNLDEVEQILKFKDVSRIMLDNFSFEDTKKAVVLINHQCEIESSGGITDETLVEYAKCGVDFISVGALTHSIKNMDLSLKATS